MKVIRKILVIGVLLAAATGAVGYLKGWWGGDAGGVEYRRERISTGDVVQTVTANGALGAVQTVDVGSEVSGKIVELFADYNSIVTNGQVLAKLDDSSYLRQQEQSEADVDSAKASLKLAEANFMRAKELRAAELISQADYDQAEATLAQAKASLRMKEASLEKVMVDIEKTTIFSPMDGIVISRAVDVGQTVAASLNAPTLFTLAQDLRVMRIEAEISEADVGGVEEGQDVTFTVDAYPERTFTGVVSQVRFEPVTVQNVVNYIAIVDVDNQDMKLRPGMTANASVITAKREGVLRVPNSALRFRPPAGIHVEDSASGMPSAPPSGARPPAPPAFDGERERGTVPPTSSPSSTVFGSTRRSVYKPVADKAALVKTSVQIGVSDGTWTEILDGLRPGDEVVTGILTASEKGRDASAANNRSPFMPGPPGRR